MSVEGMWAIYFGDVSSVPGSVPNSGVVVLETGKVFGGDSHLAYLGSYVLSGRLFSARAQTWTYNPQSDVISAFGRQGQFDVDTALEGEYDPFSRPPSIRGTIHEAANPERKLAVIMVRISDLP